MTVSLLPQSLQNSYYPALGSSYNEFDLPVLQEPKQNLGLMLLKLQDFQVEFLDYSLADGSRRLDDERERKKIINDALSEKLKEAADKARASSNWEIAGKVVSWFAAIGSIVLGTICIATGAGALPGALMIVAGAAVIIHQLATELKLWDKLAEHFSGGDKAKKEEILKQINLWVTVGTLILSIGSMAAGTGAVLQNAVKVTMLVVQSFTSISGGTVKIGQTVVDIERNSTEAEVKRLDGRKIHNKRTIEEITEAQQDLMESSKRSRKAIDRALEAEKNIMEAAISILKSR